MIKSIIAVLKLHTCFGSAMVRDITDCWLWPYSTQTDPLLWQGATIHCVSNKKLSLCWQTGKTRLEVSQVTKHSTVPHVRYSFLLCNSNFVFKTRRLPIFDFKNVMTLKPGSQVTQGHWKWYHSIDWVWFLSVFYRNFVPKTYSEIFDFKNAVTLKTGLGVRQGHWKYHHSIQRIRLHIDIV